MWEYRDNPDPRFEMKANGKMGFVQEIEEWIHDNDHEAAVVIFIHHASIRFSTPEKATLFKMFWT